MYNSIDKKQMFTRENIVINIVGKCQCYNPGEIIWQQVKKSKNFRQDQIISISVFT